MYNPSEHRGHDHWAECDRPQCDQDGAVHATVTGHERPLWLCRKHAADVAAGRNPEAR
jgi:hypothetical protein